MKNRKKVTRNQNEDGKRRSTKPTDAMSTLPDDRTVRDLLRPLANRAKRQLADPSEEAIERFCSIPLVCDPVSSARPVHGKVVFDSWAGTVSQALRDNVDGHIRRLKLRAGRLTLEIVAERRDNRWEFVARASLGRKVSHRFVLQVGRRRLLPQTGGFYIWDSRSVPHLLRLESFDNRFVFEKLSWR